MHCPWQIKIKSNKICGIYNHTQEVIGRNYALPRMDSPWKLFFFQEIHFPRIFNYFKARELSCHSSHQKQEHWLLRDFWQLITTQNTEQITPPVGSKRIVAGLSTWHCHVNVIHERKKICQVLILPGYHQKVVNIQVFGHVQHSCNVFFFFFFLQFRQAFAYSRGTLDPMMGDSQR